MRNLVPPFSNCQNEILFPTHHTEGLFPHSICVSPPLYSPFFVCLSFHNSAGPSPLFPPSTRIPQLKFLPHFPLTRRNSPQNSHVCTRKEKLSSTFAHQPFHDLSFLSAKTLPRIMVQSWHLRCSPIMNKWELLKCHGRSRLHLPLLFMLSGARKVSCFLYPSYLMILSNRLPHLAF